LNLSFASSKRETMIIMITDLNEFLWRSTETMNVNHLAQALA